MRTRYRQCTASRVGVCTVDDDGYCRHQYGKYQPRLTPGRRTRYCAGRDCTQYPSKLCFGCAGWLCFDCYRLHRKYRAARDLYFPRA